MSQKLRALALVLGPVCLVFVSLWVGLGRNAAASPSPFDTPPQGAELILDQAGLGRVAFEHESVFGPQCVTAAGDSFSPISSTHRPPGYYTNPQYSSDFYTYRYRIDIPADYGFDVVRVELFDPDTYNHSPGLVNEDFSTYVISHTLAAQATGLPATETFTCNFGNSYRYRFQPCTRVTGEATDLNPLWFVKVDEIRAGNGTSCGIPAGNDYNNGHPTQTAFDLYYYGQSITGTTQVNPLANYVGRMDNAHDTDMRWVSPGGAQSYDQPTFVPANSGSFEVDLTTIPNILMDPATGVRSLYLDVTTLAGASENGFEIWAGPPVYTGAQGTASGNCTTSVPGQMAGAPSQVNKRNLFVTNCGRNSHASEGVTVYALDYAPTNANTDNPVNIPVTYIGPEYAGQSIYVTLFDVDSGSRGPLVFYFDTLAFHLLNPVPNPPANPVNPALTDFYRAFSVNNNPYNDPDLLPGQTRNCYIGNCNNVWITPSYRIDIPTLSPDCVDMQTTPLLCTPFYGGTLMARLISGATDSYAWHVELPELPLPDITQGCTGVFPITVNELIRSLTEVNYQIVLNSTNTYPASPPSYASLLAAGHTPNHSLAITASPGDAFLLIGQGSDILNFNWLRWGSVSQPDDVTSLANSLTWPGDSFLFEEAGDPTDVTIHERDWVALNSSSVYGTAAETQLKTHIERGRTLRLVLYRESGPDGIRIAQLANFRVLAYRLNDANPWNRWLLLQFVGYVDECGHIPLVTFGTYPSIPENTTPVEGKIRLNRAFLFPVTVSYTTFDTEYSTATPGVDYVPVSGTVTFAPGETVNPFTVPILDDSYAEQNERFYVQLLNPISVTIDNPSVVYLTIVDDDPNPSIIRFAAADPSISESSGSISITVTHDGVYTGTVQVDFISLDNTAQAGVDYQAISTTLTFPPGVLTQTVEIPLINDDSFEPDETFKVQLHNPINGIFWGSNTRTITILNDDAPPELSFAAASPTVSENISSGVLSVTVQLAPTSGITATLAYSTSDGTATAGLDYQPIQGIITFTAGTTSAVIPVPILNDALAEGNEWFHLTLSDPVNGVITGTNPAQIVIVDDECLYNLYAAPGRVEAENFTCGGEGVAYHDTTPANEGNSAYRLLESVDVWDDAAASHTHYVGGTEDGEWLVYTVEITATGKYDVWVAAASVQSGSCFRVEIDGVDVTGQVVVPVTGGVFGEVAAAARLTLSAGTHQIRLAIPCGGADFDYLSFAPSPPDELYLPVMLKP